MAKESKLAVITRLTEDKEVERVKMEELVKGDFFIMENDEGELTSVDRDGKFILKALANPGPPEYKNIRSIKCDYYA